MFRKLLGITVLLALPALLAGQAKPAPTHGIDTQVRGEVAAPHDLTGGEANGQNHEAGVHEEEGENNQEGVNEPDGPNHEGGINEPDGPNHEDGLQDAGGSHEEDQGTPATPAPGQNSRIGPHKP